MIRLRTAAEGRSRRRAWRFASRLHGRAVQPKAPGKETVCSLTISQAQPAEIVQPFKNACVAFLFVGAVRQNILSMNEGIFPQRKAARHWILLQKRGARPERRAAPA